ncbi:MAG: dehydratase [Nitrospinota bacterium]|nr:MAG: dehydratase [Nitrospinota bacterium]
MGTRFQYWEELNVGDELPPLVKKPTTRQLVQYAGASGDFYEIHYDKDFALKAGLPGVIVHGLLSGAWLAQLLTDCFPPLSLRKFGVSYRGMARPGDTITCKGVVTKKYTQNGEHYIECDIRSENQEGQTTTIGKATVVLPSREG